MLCHINKFFRSKLISDQNPVIDENTKWLSFFGHSVPVIDKFENNVNNIKEGANPEVIKSAILSSSDCLRSL